ncbi:hypothetical protein PoB_000877200 [Plakobranchus ocellatus]|uniref:Uncharacterized protein n=1 Tax=Plakobranchus ocellatus TaxID=259542 RepID=A0AAV3YJA2_9GAST|nr:hypothetical protein PoB_000877200 [Plakobranchus ocellatus]
MRSYYKILGRIIRHPKLDGNTFIIQSYNPNPCQVEGEVFAEIVFESKYMYVYCTLSPGGKGRGWAVSYTGEDRKEEKSDHASHRARGNVLSTMEM